MIRTTLTLQVCFFLCVGVFAAQGVKHYVSYQETKFISSVYVGLPLNILTNVDI